MTTLPFQAAWILSHRRNSFWVQDSRWLNQFHEIGRHLIFPDCDKKFTSKFKLKRHILIHSQTKTFLCDVCHRAFRRKDHLRNHEKVHDPGKTIYTCTYDTCARTYNSVTSFRKHQVSWVTKVGSPKSWQFCFCFWRHSCYAFTVTHILLCCRKRPGFALFLPKKFSCLAFLSLTNIEHCRIYPEEKLYFYFDIVY